MKKNGKKISVKIGMTLLLLLATVIIFAGYSYENTRRVKRMNATYIKNSTKATAQWVEDILDNARSSIRDAAYLYGRTLTDGAIHPDDLQKMADNALFDYIEFVDADGNDINVQGVEADVSERSYFVKGMQGESGMDGAYTSKITGERLVIFYAPVIYEGKIIGVLTGQYQEARMQKILEDRLFDEQVPSFLCLPDGTVVSCVGFGKEGDNILDYMEGKVSEQELKGITEALAEEKEFAFSYRSNKGMTMAYVASLPGNSWTLVQLFPIDALNEMKREANAAGFLLEIELLFLFTLYLLYVMAQEWRLQKRLSRGKQQAENIISGIRMLFSRFILVDLDEDTYEYISGVPEEFSQRPRRGKFSDYREYLRDKIISREDYSMETVMSVPFIRQHLNEKTPFVQYEYQIRIGEKIRWQNTAIIALESEDDKVTKVLFAVQEITGAKEEELRTQEALRHAYHAAEAANNAKSEFLSRMSHDIRTPMNAIMGMTSIAQMHTDDTARLKDCLEKIAISSRHLLRLINEVLDMSKIESGKLELMNEEFDLSDMVNEMMTIFHPQMEIKDQFFSATMGGVTHEKVVGDCQRLSQVLVNIMGNAVKFTPVGGCISLHIDETPSSLEGRACYEFTVTDTGIGMSQEFVEKIFEPFERATDPRTSNTEGTGLGMSIAKNIINLMNGDIEIKSKKGEGTRIKVIVTLPYISEEQEEELELLAGRRVLVVDDEASVCENACKILVSIGMKADYRTNGDDALEELEKELHSGNRYSAVILDWRMPGKNGVEITREIRSRMGNNMPVIILSAYDWSAIEKDARAAGANDFIAKPLFKSRLIYVMKRTLLGAGDNERQDPQELLKPEEAFAGKRILLVEDNELNREIAVEILTTEGFLVDQAQNGKEALDTLLSSEPDTYHLVLMDVQMPVMNGYDATIAVRRSGRKDLEKIPIIAMTADAFSDDIRKAIELGMNGHIAKPIDIGKLINVLRDWM